jgi:hypothetical protein
MMPQTGAEGMEAVQQPAERFVVILQGAIAWAGLAEGVEGVKDTLLRVLWSNPGGAVLGEVAAILDSLDDPAAWAVHGAGDGRPYWHWWLGYDGGSVTVQRLTEPTTLADRARAARLAGAVADAVGPLADCAEDLRRLAGAAEEGYVFAARPSSNQPDAGPPGT